MSELVVNGVVELLKESDLHNIFIFTVVCEMLGLLLITLTFLQILMYAKFA
jgi:hypothetical protein